MRTIMPSGRGYRFFPEAVKVVDRAAAKKGISYH
jgi:hypothetical protein